jgi:hypothetical protein
MVRSTSVTHKRGQWFRISIQSTKAIYQWKRTALNGFFRFDSFCPLLTVCGSIRLLRWRKRDVGKINRAYDIMI